MGLSGREGCEDQVLSTRLEESMEIEMEAGVRASERDFAEAGGADHC